MRTEWKGMSGRGSGASSFSRARPFPGEGPPCVGTGGPCPWSGRLGESCRRNSGQQPPTCPVGSGRLPWPSHQGATSCQVIYKPLEVTKPRLGAPSPWLVRCWHVLAGETPPRAASGCSCTRVQARADPPVSFPIRAGQGRGLSSWGWKGSLRSRVRAEVEVTHGRDCVHVCDAVRACDVCVAKQVHVCGVRSAQSTVHMWCACVCGSVHMDTCDACDLFVCM